MTTTRKIFIFTTLTALLLTSVLFFSAPYSVEAQDMMQGTNVPTLNGVENDTASVQASQAVGGVAGAQQKAGYRPNSVSCSGTWSDIFSPATCITRALFAGIAAFFIYIGVTFLTACGLLFEFVLHYTVVSFKTPMYDAVSAAIVAAWSAFRDISNILIIGFFTFIAISTILGSHEYGAKKLLARVLIVAVLINFSLLFTKLIIDSSNFLAYQFYNASLSNVDKDGAQGRLNTTAGSVVTVDVGTAKTQVAGAGIAGTFIRYLGVTGIADSYSKVREQQEAADNALYGLAFGLLAFIFLVAVGLVFLYGSFLLISRAILFIFLLITSSLAFATYLIPSLSDKYGWKKWWGSLVSNALLAPVLMMMLWVTLTVSASLSGGLVKAADGSTGTLGALASNTTSTANISALFGYLIILGLLFASFKLASSFSSGIMGFNFAAMIPAFGLGFAAQAAGLLGRQTVGRVSLAASDRLKTASENDKSSKFARRLADFGSQRFKSVAKQDFNAMRTPLGAGIAGSAGVKLDTLAGKAVKGFEGSQKAFADRLAEQARRMTPDKDAQNDRIGKAIANEIKNSPALAERSKQASAVHENTKTDHATEQAALVTMHEQHARDMKALQTTLEEAQRAGDTAGAATAQQNIAQARGRQAIAIDEQTQRIRRASDAIESSRNEISRVESRAKDLAIAKGVIPEKFKDADQTAADLAHGRFTSALFSEKENERLARMASHDVGIQKSRKSLEESGMIDVLRTAIGGGGHDAPPIAHVAAPTATPPHTAADAPPPAHDH